MVVEEWNWRRCIQARFGKFVREIGCQVLVGTRTRKRNGGFEVWNRFVDSKIQQSPLACRHLWILGRVIFFLLGFHMDMLEKDEMDRKFLLLRFYILLDWLWWIICVRWRSLLHSWTVHMLDWCRAFFFHSTFDVMVTVMIPNLFQIFLKEDFSRLSNLWTSPFVPYFECRNDFILLFYTNGGQYIVIPPMNKTTKRRAFHFDVRQRMCRELINMISNI